MIDDHEMKEKVITWIFEDKDTGVSSIAMAATLLDRKPRRTNTPSDPSDFNRCLLFLDAVPEARKSMHKFANINNDWATLVANWDKIEQCFLDEVGLNWSKGRTIHAKKTFDLMRDLAS